MAVNERNAAGSRVVTAANGAAGIPAVLRYYAESCKPSNPEQGIRGASLHPRLIYVVQKNASISGAEIGCQGEVGVACAMATLG